MSRKLRYDIPGRDHRIHFDEIGGAPSPARWREIFAADLPEVAGLSEKSARALPFRMASDFLEQLREYGRAMSTVEWPEYSDRALIGALVAGVALPCLAALLFSRLDITD